jgi:CHAT domain-containing protein/tetratricopeptide (TPR) repeat protein
MHAWLLLGLLAAVPSGLAAAQDPGPIDPALIQQLVNGDSPSRQKIVGAFKGDPLQLRIAVIAAGQDLSKQGRGKEAIRVFETALELSTLMGAERSEISALINIGMVYGQAGEYTASVRYFNAALEKTQKDRDDDLIAAAGNNLGNIYRRRGEYAKALEVQQRVLQSNIDAGREPQAARTLNNIGLIYELQGDFGRAIDYYLRSLELKERIGDADDVITTLSNIGSFYTLQGNHVQALEYLERSLGLAEKSKNVRLIVGSLGNIGRILIESGRLDAAESHLSRARQLSEDAGYTEQLAITLTSLANLEIERGRWAPATAYLARAHSLLVSIGDPPAMGQVLLLEARIALESGRPAEAVALAEKARATISAVGRPTALIDAEVLYGEALTSVRRWNDAIATFERAVANTERTLDLLAGDTEDRYRFLDSVGNAYDGLVHAYASAGRPREALGAAERGRARTLLDMLSAGRGGEDELSEAERNRRIDLDTMLSALNQRLAEERRRAGRPDPKLAAEFDRVRQTRNEFYLGLDKRHPRLRFARGEAPVLTDGELAAALPARSALVEFVVGPRGAWVMLLVPKADGEPRLVARPAGLPPRRLTTLATEFTRQVATRDLAFTANARSLYDALFGPIADELAGVEQLIVVPHGSLWELPFQALRTPDARYLVEAYAIAYAPSASALRALESRRGPRPDQPRVVAFGDPQFADTRATPLPHSAREARDVAGIYGSDSSIATSADASEARFRQLAPRADIIHIATHGVLDNASPLFSYLMLAGSGTARPGDGRLEGHELINMRLGAELVVLSACDTARGRVSNGEGVVGLSWALFAAGASTTTVSLWPVDSASTTDLMSAFHRDRRRLIAASTPAATAKALRTAQLGLLARPESRHPFYWAGFVVIGVP